MFTIDKQDTGIFTVSATFSPVADLTIIGQEYVFLVDNINDFKEIIEFQDTVSGELDSRTVSREYSLSENLSDWSDWFEWGFLCET